MSQKYTRENITFEVVSIHKAGADLIVLTDMVTCSTDNENVVCTLEYREIQQREAMVSEM